MTEKIGVMFIQSQEKFGADAVIHASIMRHLDRSRFEVHVACTSGSGNGPPRSLSILREIPNLNVRPTHFLPGLRGQSRASIGRALLSASFVADMSDLRRYVKTNRIQLIHSGDHPRDCAYAVALSRVTPARSIVHVHVKWASHYSPIARWSVQNASAVFGISEYVSRTVVEMGRPRADVHTVLNGIDVERFDPTIDGSGVRREFGIAPEAPLIASVSRLFSWKGQRELIRALALAHKVLPEIKLLIVGADELMAHSGSFTAELKQLAAELGVTDSVVFTGQRSDVPQIMAACDVFTLPSFEEPFGLVFAETMAMQKPVVALDNGGTPEVVEHGKSGLLSRPQDIGALAANIVTLLRNPELRQRLGSHGRRRVIDYLNAERMTRDAERAYAKILGAS